MFFISHRGNLYGPNKKEENKVDYINEAIKKKFDVEIDLWFVKNNFYLGHDEPKHKINVNHVIILNYSSDKKFSFDNFNIKDNYNNNCFFFLNGLI